MQGAIYPSLKDRTVLVTGGGSGIGEAIVRQFVGQGAMHRFGQADLFYGGDLSRQRVRLGVLYVAGHKPPRLSLVVYPYR